jgi:hypothetical protein
MIKDPFYRAVRLGARNNASYEREREWRNGKWLLTKPYFFVHDRHCQWSLFL